MFACTLGEIAKKVGVDYRTLKNWRDRGLITPSVKDCRGSGHVSLYGEDDLIRARQIAVLRRAGVELDAIERIGRLDDRDLDRLCVLLSHNDEERRAGA